MESKYEKRAAEAALRYGFAKSSPSLITATAALEHLINIHKTLRPVNNGGRSWRGHSPPRLALPPNFCGCLRQSLYPASLGGAKTGGASLLPPDPPRRRAPWWGFKKKPRRILRPLAERDITTGQPVQIKPKRDKCIKQPVQIHQLNWRGFAPQTPQRRASPPASLGFGQTKGNNKLIGSHLQQMRQVCLMNIFKGRPMKTNKTV